MKKSLIAFLIPLFLSSYGFAQTAQSVSGKKQPFQIKLQEKANISQQNSVFQRAFDMTADDELRSVQKTDDQLGFSHEKFQQYYKGVKVDGATYTVHAKNGMFDLMTGDYWKVADLDVKPSLTADAAFAAALTHVGARQYAWEDAVKADYPDYAKPQGELVIVADPEGKALPRLAYKFEIYASDPLYGANVFVDAHSGAFIQEHPLICDVNVPATGNALYNGSVSFTADQVSASSYRLRQTASGGGIQTYNLNNGTNYTAATDFTSATANFTADPVGVQAHFGAEKTYDYYFTQHGRNSYNGAGAIIRSYVHYSNNYANAFWSNNRMTYGDGGGAYSPLVSLDICGHEITHGVTQYSANLVYSYQSGALNESFSDIFGEAIENYASGSNDWLMGADIFISGGAIRSMANPNAYGDPDTYLGTYWYAGTGDNGGVHTNSGVQNKWFYILSQGESGTNDNGDAYSVTGIGMANAAAIAYRNLTVYLTSSSNYSAARAGAIQAAIDLFGAGSAEEIATTDAWYAVGVGAGYNPGGGGGPLLSGYFETGWDGWADGGGDCARVSSANSYEGSYSIQIRDNSGIASATTSPVVDVSGNSDMTLQFYFRAAGMENGEDFWVQYYNGSSWSTIASFARGADFNNNTFYVVTIPMSSAQFAFPTNAQFRFQCDASDNSDQVYIDAVTLTAGSAFNILGDDTAGLPEIRPLEDNSAASEANGFIGDDETDNVVLYPNPVTNLLHIQSDAAVKNVRIFATNGALMLDSRALQNSNTIDMSGLTPGFYFISVETENAVVKRKIVKR